MSFSQAQPVEVTLTQDTSLRPEMFPAVNIQTAQQVGIARVGDNQTVTTEPSA